MDKRMDKNTDFDKKYFQNNNKKRQTALKSINNYLGQLKMHFQLTDAEMFDILKKAKLEYKKGISSKKWWNIFD